MTKKTKTPKLKRQKTVVYPKLEMSIYQYLLELGDNKRLKIDYWNNELRADIRQWFVGHNGSLFPTKRGSSLTMRRFKTLIDNAEIISQNIKTGKQEPIRLGSQIYAMTDEKGVHIRKYFLPTTSHCLYLPSKFGLFLTTDQWQVFFADIPNLLEALPEIQQTITCRDDPTHLDPQIALGCGECNFYPMNSNQIDDLMKQIMPDYSDVEQKIEY